MKVGILAGELGSSLAKRPMCAQSLRWKSMETWYFPSSFACLNADLRLSLP
jgi:hypothetical protein